jgi:hypothetical protein
MRKTRVIIFCLSILLLFATAASAQKQAKAPLTESDWLGTYEYEQVEPRNPSSGYVDSITYTVIVSRKGGSIVARFTADGHMANDDYECTVKADGNQLDLYYAKDLRSSDAPGLDRHLKKGKLFSSLVRATAARGRTKYIYKDTVFFNPKYPPAFKKKI